MIEHPVALDTTGDGASTGGIELTSPVGERVPNEPHDATVWPDKER